MRYYISAPLSLPARAPARTAQLIRPQVSAPSIVTCHDLRSPNSKAAVARSTNAARTSSGVPPPRRSQPSLTRSSATLGGDRQLGQYRAVALSLAQAAHSQPAIGHVAAVTDPQMPALPPSCTRIQRSIKASLQGGLAVSFRDAIQAAMARSNGSREGPPNRTTRGVGSAAKSAFTRSSS